jgi:hypothetical protein
MRWMIDQYYEEPLTNLDKAYFPLRPTTPEQAASRAQGRLRSAGSTTSGSRTWVRGGQKIGQMITTSAASTITTSDTN